MFKNFHLILALSCGFIIGILSLIQNDDIITLMIKMILTIVVFFILGLIARNYIKKIISRDINNKKKETLESNNMQKDIETNDEEDIEVN